MHVASLELSKELYELSGWDDCEVWHRRWAEGNGGTQTTRPSNEMIWTGDLFVPAYDLGYLLRKLPRYINTNPDSYFSADLYVETAANNRWSATYRVGAGKPIYVENADTPEDAACKLAIELIKQGVLKHD